MKNSTRITIGLALLAVVIAGSMYLFSGRYSAGVFASNAGMSAESATSVSSLSSDSALANIPPPRSTSTPQTHDLGSDQRGYTNTSLRFSLEYPHTLKVTEYKETNGGTTITFESSDAQNGFQIYVQPYAGTQITQERFRLDEQSGVAQQQTEILVDGTRAEMFFGHNNVMGNTREVWFIRGGYLYEISTYKDLDSWLGAIMKSWKFT